MMKKMARIIGRYLEDALILGGLGLVIYATFTLSYTAGLYVFGACMLGAGVWFTVHPLGKD